MALALIIEMMISGYFTKTARIPRSVNGDEWRFWIRIRKLPCAQIPYVVST
jgi:hypothetical protein